jgi:sedoheptulose-bisphosphatase
VSPRARAQRTLELLGVVDSDKLPWKAEHHHEGHSDCHALVEITDRVQEWDYGDYEGLTSAQIREQRTEQGKNPQWEIWSEGCPGGE